MGGTGDCEECRREKEGHLLTCHSRLTSSEEAGHQLHPLHHVPECGGQGLSSAVVD